MANNNLVNFTQTTGSATAYVLTDTDVNFVANGQEFFIKPHVTNSGSATLAVNGNVAKTLKKNGSNLSAGDLVANTLVVLSYDTTLDVFNISRVETILSGVAMSPQPASAAAAGSAGQIAYASGFFYVCVAANTWQRVAIATW